MGHFAYENMPPKKRVLKKRRSQIDIIAQRKMVHDPNYKKGQMIDMIRRHGTSTRSLNKQNET